MHSIHTVIRTEDEVYWVCTMKGQTTVYQADGEKMTTLLRSASHLDAVEFVLDPKSKVLVSES